jgi:hypothetical protein
MGYRLRISDALRRPRRLLLFFLLLTVAPAAGLVYAGWTLVVQDRDRSERFRTRREQATDLIVTALKQEVAAVQQQLADPSNWPSLRSDDTRLVVLGVRRRLPEAPWALFLPDASRTPKRRSRNGDPEVQGTGDQPGCGSQGRGAAASGA